MSALHSPVRNTNGGKRMIKVLNFISYILQYFFIRVTVKQIPNMKKHKLQNQQKRKMEQHEI